MAKDDLLKRFLDLIKDVDELPDWEPPIKTDCMCGHSWLFHWLKVPHKCNNCDECTGYEPRLIH